MPRIAQVAWHDRNKAWRSDVGEFNEKGRRKPVYFRDIPYGPVGSANHRKARAALEAYLAARDARPDPEGGDLTFGDLARMYLDHFEQRVARDKAAPKTLRSHRGALKRAIYEAAAGGVLLRDRPAAALTATEMGAILDRWAEDGLKPNYAGRILATIQGVLNWAADPLPGRRPEKLLVVNPLGKLSHEATRAPQSPDRYAEEAEVRAFLAWGYERARTYLATRGTARGKLGGQRLGPFDDRFERLTIDLIRVAWLTGTRPGELRVAEWPDYEPRAVEVAALGEWWGRIRLDPKRWKSGRKTGREREIFLPPEAVGVIESIRALEDRHPRFIWTHRAGKVRRVREVELAGPPPALPAHGVMWAETALPNKVAKLRREAIAAGVPLLDEGPNRFVMYRLRHTRAADLLMAGVDVATVAKLLGTSVEMIERTYGSFTGRHLAEAAARGIAPRGAAPGAG